MDKKCAWDFARAWEAAWNAHDLERVLSHYTDDFEMTSPFIVGIAGEASAKLKGKAAVAGYWRRALESMPELHFEVMDVLFGQDSVVIYYKSVQEKLAAEMFFFNADGKVYQAIAHYNH